MVGQLPDLCDYAAAAAAAAWLAVFGVVPAHSPSQVSMLRGLTWNRDGKFVAPVRREVAGDDGGDQLAAGALCGMLSP